MIIKIIHDKGQEAAGGSARRAAECAGGGRERAGAVGGQGESGADGGCQREAGD